MSYLKRLNEAFEKLANARSLDDLYRRAVVTAREQLGFDRAGILLYDRSTNEQVGTWGTDAYGDLRDEHDFRIPVDESYLILRPDQGRIRLNYDTELWEMGDIIGTGWHIQAAIFSGEELFGWLFIDNFINKDPLLEDHYQVALSFSNVLGQLIVRSKIEDTLLQALDTLASHEGQTLSALDKVSQLESQLAGSRKMILLAERLSGLVPMSARAVGNLVNFISLLSPSQFADADRALLTSAKKSADQLSRIYRHFDQKVHDATDNDLQTLQSSVIQEYWSNQFGAFFRGTPFHLEVRTENPEEEITLPLILLTQLVKELLNNALFHGLESCDHGNALVTLSHRDAMLSVTVEDSGIGLDEDQYEDVLKLFVTSKPYEFLGSGLNVIQHYVERWLNGQLELEPSHLGGLRCRLQIPLAQP